MEAHELARQVGEARFAVNRARHTLEIELPGCEPGRARMRKAARGHRLHSHRICHGGFIVTLADATFAYARNSRNRNIQD